MVTVRNLDFSNSARQKAIDAASGYATYNRELLAVDLETIGARPFRKWQEQLELLRTAWGVRPLTCSVGVATWWRHWIAGDEPAHALLAHLAGIDA